jgi:dTMP kinase
VEGRSAPGALFIAFEGVEGAGKSTQIRLVADGLRQSGTDPVVTREPGGTRAGEAIRAVALDRELDLDPVAELLLMLAARSAFVREVVRPAHEAGRIVLTDRYELSTFAYQGGGRGLSMDSILRQARSAADRIEGEALTFHRSVAEAYRELAYSRPDVALVDGRGEIEEVFAAVWEVLNKCFPETFPPREG